MSSPDRNIQLRLQAMSGYLTPNQIGSLVTKTTINLLGDAEVLGSPVRRFVAEYFDLLATRQERAAEAARALRGVLPKNEAPRVQLGELMFGAGSDLRAKYGNPALYGLDVPMSPQNLEEARLAVEGRALAEAGLAEAYDDQLGER